MKGILSLALATVLYVLKEHAVESFKGIKMCQIDCELTKGCTGIYYGPVHLDCRFLFDLEKREYAALPAVTKRIIKNCSLKNRMKNCTLNSRLIVTGQKKDICLESGAETAKQEHSLLVVTGSKSYQIDLETHVVRPFQFPWKDINSVIFLKAAKRFVINQKGELFSTTGIKGKRVTWRRHVNVYDMEADEREDIIFLKTVFKAFGFNVCKVNQRGTQFKSVLRYINVFAIDRKHKLLYVYKDKQMASYTYKGQVTRVVGNYSRYMRKLQYCPVQEALYYASGGSLWTLTGGGIEVKLGVLRVHQKTEYVHSMKIHGHYLYIAARRIYNEIVAVSVGNGFEIKVIRIQVNSSDDEIYRKVFLL